MTIEEFNALTDGLPGDTDINIKLVGVGNGKVKLELDIESMWLNADTEEEKGNA